MMNRLYFYLLFLIRPDRLFLALVIFCCGLNFYFFYSQNLQSVNQNVDQAKAIVIDYSEIGIVKKPIVIMENSVYLVESKSKLSLQVGQNIVVRGVIKPFVFDESFNQYLLTTGVRGILEIQSIYTFPDCNINCQFFKWLDNVKYYYTKNYTNWFCDPAKKVWFSNLANCNDLAGLAVGFSIGGNQSLTDQTKLNFRNLGLTHLIAVSGFQVVLMIDIAAKVSEKLKFNGKIRPFMQLGLIFSLVLIVGLQAPVLRAAISGIISLFVSSVGRKISALRSIIWAGIILIFWNPAILLSLSFQLSFAATLGLILLPNFNFDWLEKTPEFIKELISSFFTTSACTLWTLPLIVQINSKISALSILANLVVSPFISFSTILSFLGQIPIIGELFLIINSAILILILNIIDIVSGWNIFLNFDKFSGFEILIYYLFLLIILLFLHRKNKSKNYDYEKV